MLIVTNSSTKPTQPEQYSCRDGCGRTIALANVSQWERGEITGRYRCPDCRQALNAVRYIGSNVPRDCTTNFGTPEDIG